MTSKNVTFPTVTFSHSLEMESRRILHLSASLAIRWYQNHDFLILPTLPTKVPTATVVFPDLSYTTIPRFWSRVARLKLKTPIVAPAPLLSATHNLLAPHYHARLYYSHVSRLRSAWESVDSNFWSQLFTFFPTYQPKIKHVNIYLTLYGPYTTFNLARGDETTLTIFARFDCTIEKIMWTICTCLFRPVMQDKLKMTWREIESAIDWLLHESSLSLGHSLPEPTIKNLRSPQIAKYRQASTTYLSHLGLNQVSA